MSLAFYSPRNGRRILAAALVGAGAVAGASRETLAQSTFAGGTASVGTKTATVCSKTSNGVPADAPLSATCDVPTTGGSVKATVTSDPGGTGEKASVDFAQQSGSITRASAFGGTKRLVSIGGGNPLDIFRIVLRAAYEVSSTGDPNAALLENAVSLSGVNAATNLSFRSSIFRGFPAQLNTGILETFIDIGELGGATTFGLSESMSADILVRTGTSNPDNALTATSSAFIDDPTITLVDADGNDVTGRYSLTYENGEPVTATPEPMTMSLVATGFAGVGLRGRRRKRRATASSPS